MPQVSVLMGTYNEKSKKQAARAIDSILSQTFTDFEFLICDDGSEESFYRWLRAYCRKDDRIRLFRNKKNKGLAAVLNRCLRYAKGAYIARMDADDISMEGRLEKQAAFLRQHPSCALVGCSAGMYGRHGVWGIRSMEAYPQKTSFLQTSPFIHPSIMIRRDVLKAAGGYNASPAVLRAEDYELFMRLYAKGYYGCNLQEVLFLYREEPQSYTKRRYRYRINECRVRWHGFWELGILKGNGIYVIKPLLVGLLPDRFMRKVHRKRYEIGNAEKESRKYNMEEIAENDWDCDIEL
ncbi:MAG: glycosyltransferase [Eubacterium sp.]|nr:glycosyltransferase [Eubacterium sp.]